MNSTIRKMYGFEGNLPKYGERVICRKNNWDISIDGIALANGLAGHVVNNPDPSSFNADGTCSYDASGTLMKCTYKTDGDKLSILYDGDTVSFDTTYSIDGNKLNVKDSFGNDTIYTKK